MNKSKISGDIILIVDDTAANHDVLRAFLEDIGVSCESAFDGMEAITACSDTDGNYYSLILMDVNLPYMDGIQTTQKLRELGVTSPVIAVTASSGDEMKTKNASDVFDSILYKPFNSTKLFTVISPYIENAASCRLDADPSDRDEAGSSLIDSRVCDVSRGIANMGNSPRLFTKHLNNFKKNNADLVIRINALLKNHEYDECAKLCHSIKGLAGMLGLTSLYERFIGMEDIIERVRREDCTEDELSRILSGINNDIRLICRLPL